MPRRAIRIFLDSNVALPGLFSDRGSPRIILDLLSLNLPVLTGVTGEFNIVEIERNLQKKMSRVLPTYREYLPLLNLEITPLPSTKEVRSLKGQIAQKGLPVLASAFNADVDFLVTGDKKDFGKARIRGRYPFRIVTPTELLQAILPEILPLLEAD
jgi:predicted nucleic acid-binding protein